MPSNNGNTLFLVQVLLIVATNAVFIPALDGCLLHGNYILPFLLPFSFCFFLCVLILLFSSEKNLESPFFGFGQPSLRCRIFFFCIYAYQSSLLCFYIRTSNSFSSVCFWYFIPANAVAIFIDMVPHR